MQPYPLPDPGDMPVKVRDSIRELFRGLIGTGSPVEVGSFMFSLNPPEVIQDPWLVCNGQAVSRVTYKPLYDRIGIQYGAGDGTTTFNLPRCACRIPIGFDRGLIGPSGEVLDIGAMTTQAVDVTGVGKTHDLDFIYLTPIVLGR